MRNVERIRIIVLRRGGRADETTGLENRRAARLRGFESRPLRHAQPQSKWVAELTEDFSKARMSEPGGVVKRSKTTVC